MTSRWPDRQATHVLGFRAVDPHVDESTTAGFLVFVDLEATQPITLIEPWWTSLTPNEPPRPWRTMYARPDIH